MVCLVLQASPVPSSIYLSSAGSYNSAAGCPGLFVCWLPVPVHPSVQYLDVLTWPGPSLNTTLSPVGLTHTQQATFNHALPALLVLFALTIYSKDCFQKGILIDHTVQLGEWSKRLL